MTEGDPKQVPTASESKRHRATQEKEGENVPSTAPRHNNKSKLAYDQAPAMRRPLRSFSNGPGGAKFAIAAVAAQKKQQKMRQQRRKAFKRKELKEASVEDREQHSELEEVFDASTKARVSSRGSLPQSSSTEPARVTGAKALVQRAKARRLQGVRNDQSKAREMRVTAVGGVRVSKAKVGLSPRRQRNAFSTKPYPH